MNSETTILVIDDNSELLENTAEVLANSGFIVLTAENGDKGIKLAVSKIPNLILCDILMRDMDGYAVLKAIKAYRNAAGISFIFFTSMAEQIEMDRGLSMGANDYLVKPYRVEELLLKINRVLCKST